MDNPSMAQMKSDKGVMIKTRLVLAIGLVASLVGCMTVGPDYTSPDQPLSVAQTADELTSIAVSQGETTGQRSPDLDIAYLDARWWQQFKDEDLNTLVYAALAGSPNIAAAQARVKAAYAVFSDVDDDAFPKGAVGAGYSASKAPVAPDFATRVKSENINAGLEAGWQLDLFGKVRRASEAAAADVQSQEAALRSVKVEIITAVVKSYGELRAAQKRVQIAEANLENLREVLNLTRLRYETGVGSELDLARTQAEFSGNEASVPPLRAQIKRALHHLQALTALTPTQMAALAVPKSIPAVNTALPIGNPRELLLRRPDIQQAERQLANATAQIGVATADLFPQVEMTGFLGFISSSGSNLGTSASQAWSITPTLKWQVLDYGSLQARVRAAEANTDVVLANYQQTVLSALEEASNALTTYDLDQQRFRFLLEQEKSSARAQALAQVRYKAGVIDLLDVLDTERTRLSAEDTVALGELQVYQGIAEIYRSLGGGWEGLENLAAND